ncbi:translation initiation factor IF-2 [Sphingomicrobium aestuariivivum]|uniref:translation initiation factor IF-2 n=1 Tax=Sphingomicrobium aestuariivivum TaxID=1582356 RepID=UPI001FD63F9D|nr:translation initiation factor IF-2 [Sphingomicrobium aestuariivivum]MCJ8191673.1 translation initiation factor IF-2 [Sphingomicrobium aestuariivivum]
MSDDKKKLGTRAPLGVKKTIEAGQVKQSFSHGRSNTVVVEVKKRRILKPGDAAAAPKEEAKTPEAEAPKKEAPAKDAARKPAPAPKKAAAPKRPLTAAERREQVKELERQAEEARMAALEESRRRDEQAKARASEEEARRAEENRKAEEEAERRAKEEAEQAKKDAAAKAKAEKAAAAAPAPRSAKPAPAKPAAPKRDDRNKGRPAPDRRSGKLTVNRALRGDGGGRARSLAALKRAREKEKRAQAGQSGPREKTYRDVQVPDHITVGDLAKRMGEKAADLVKSLFNMGMMVTVNQTIDQDTAELLVNEFGHNVQRVSDSDIDIDTTEDVDAEDTLKARPPVVTIMGHVDHGKTSLLDAIRGADVAAGEAGGITQHIGAYQVTPKGGDPITFLDTPGHEAFTEMRARGATVTDLAILVVAADDGLKPQTVEAINHIKAAGVPMIVAINKIDTAGSNPQKIREELLQHEIIVEAMSGEVQDVEVSAKEKTNIDKLLEAINLQAELLELKANPDRDADGTVVEAKLDKGRGPVATVLIKRGTLKVGDTFVAGAAAGKVRALIDDHGRRVKKAGPSFPVEVLGLSGVPSAGDQFTVVENDQRAREVAEYRQSVLDKKRTTAAPMSLESMFDKKGSSTISFPLIIKADVQGTAEAVVNAVKKISTEDIEVRVIHSGVGAITESDVTLAASSGAPIIGFNARPNAKAKEIAKRDQVELRYYDVIYHLTDWVKQAMAGELGPEIIEHIVGKAEVKQVFRSGKKDKAAGLLVLEGVIKKGLHARLTRDDVIVSKTTIASLRRFKDDVDQVEAGTECGAVLEDTNDIAPGDMLEIFEIEERERQL